MVSKPRGIEANNRALFNKAADASTSLVNDADAAGLAEMKFGAGAGHQGTVLMLTFGTGIGSALFRDGILVPNTEFGHIEIRGRDAEKRASERAKELHDLSWGKWAGRVDEYLAHMEALTAPDLIIIGGGISRKADKFLPLLTSLRATVVPAAMQNDAGGRDRSQAPGHSPWQHALRGNFCHRHYGLVATRADRVGNHQTAPPAPAVDVPTTV